MTPSYVDFGSKDYFHAGKDVYREKKEWGEEQWIVNKEYCGKKLILRKNRRCSLHKHEKKDEVFYLLSGHVRMEVGDDVFELRPGDFVHIPSGVYHRFTGLEESEIMEFSTNHQEEDSFRKEFSGHVEHERFARQKGIIEKFASAKILVVGDVMLDTYLRGVVDRISPEAPIPVVHYRGQRSVPGGAANAALNAASLGAIVTLVGVRGKDDAGKTLQSLLKKSRISASLLEDKSQQTIHKVRVISESGQQIVRLDYEDRAPLTAAQRRELLTMIKQELARADVLLLSDYAKGFFDGDMLQACIAAAKKAKAPVILDPKPQGRSYLRDLEGLTLITPNRKETMLFSQDPDDTLEIVARDLAKAMGGNVLLTLGADGMLLLEKGAQKPVAFPALARQVADVSGAGDTVAAVLALSIAAGAPLADAADLANRAASVVVTKQGTATLSQDELLHVL